MIPVCWVQVRLWVATSVGVTFRLLVQLESVCPQELPVISYTRQECLPLDDSADSTYIAIIVGAVVIAVLSLSALLCWMKQVQHASYCVSPAETLRATPVRLPFDELFADVAGLVQRGTWRLPNSHGPPKQGQNVTLVVTDIQGSTMLWDSFPDKAPFAPAPSSLLQLCMCVMLCYVMLCCVVLCCVALRGVAWRCVAWRGVAWRGVAWRGVAWRYVLQLWHH